MFLAFTSAVVSDNIQSSESMNAHPYFWQSSGSIYPSHARFLDDEVSRGVINSIDFTGKGLDGSASEYSGYIIQLEKEPIVVQRDRLNKTAQKNQDSALNKVPLVKNIYSTFATMPEDVTQKVEKHKQDIEKEREQVKQRILGNFQRRGITGNVISEQGSLEVGQEFDLVFNGFSLDVSDEEAKEIEKIRGVKAVYPNMKVELLLQDSVPLIQDGILAGQLDRNGNDCTISGEECLTGEGIKIAILDTGVDYTHGDLGGSVVEENIMKKIITM
jgi:subtilisin family serine protease